MKTSPKIAILFLITVALVACNTAEAEKNNNVSLKGQQWVLLILDNHPPLAGTQPTAEFSGNEINGSTGCNRYFGSYEVTNGKLTLTQLGMTEMACPEPEGAMEQEQAFITALNSVTSYRLTAERLEMLDTAGRVMLVFGPPEAGPKVTLENTTWMLTTFIQGETAMSLINGTGISIQFDREFVRGSAGCNDYGGVYSLERGMLGISDIALNEQDCLEPIGVMEQETQYVDLLGRVSIAEIDANQLTLRTTDGRGLVFTAQPDTIPSLLATPAAQEPAAGICGGMEGDWVVVTINPDVPDPRCAQIEPQQKLRVINHTPETVHVRLGHLEATLESEEEYAFDLPFAEYLAPGVHTPQVSPYSGPALWLKAGPP